MISLIHITSAVIYVVAYSAIATYAHLADQHRDMCVFYTLLAFAAGIHLGVVVIQIFHRRPDAAADPAATFDKVSPIPNAKRVEHYDDRGMLYRVEWEPVGLVTAEGLDGVITGSLAHFADRRCDSRSAV